jgi:hypothetical protein
MYLLTAGDNVTAGGDAICRWWYNIVNEWWMKVSVEDARSLLAEETPSRHSF